MNARNGSDRAEPRKMMDAWHLKTSPDDAFAIAEAAMQIASLVGAFRRATELWDRNEPVWEFHDESESVGRAVIQIRVDVAFFAMFFNGPDGYRGMFRRGRRVGSATNAALVDSVRSMLASALAESVGIATIRNSADGPTLMGRVMLPRSTLLRSLDPSLAKIWYATSDIRRAGIRRLSLGVSSEKIDVGLPDPWAKIVQNPGDCIIEVKGAFVGSYGLFQVKDPESRADRLSRSGEA